MIILHKKFIFYVLLMLIVCIDGNSHFNRHYFEPALKDIAKDISKLRLSYNDFIQYQSQKNLNEKCNNINNGYKKLHKEILLDEQYDFNSSNNIKNIEQLENIIKEINKAPDLFLECVKIFMHEYFHGKCDLQRIKINNQINNHWLYKNWLYKKISNNLLYKNILTVYNTWLDKENLFCIHICKKNIENFIENANKFIFCILDKAGYYTTYNYDFFGLLGGALGDLLFTRFSHIFNLEEGVKITLPDLSDDESLLKKMGFSDKEIENYLVLLLYRMDKILTLDKKKKLVKNALLILITRYLKEVNNNYSYNEIDKDGIYIFNINRIIPMMENKDLFFEVPFDDFIDKKNNRLNSIDPVELKAAYQYYESNYKKSNNNSDNNDIEFCNAVLYALDVISYILIVFAVITIITKLIKNKKEDKDNNKEELCDYKDNNKNNSIKRTNKKLVV